VLAAYWWNPVAWWSVRRLQRAEEECCDAAVLLFQPHQCQTYGEALLAVAEFVSTGRLPAPALSIGVERKNHLKRRMTMILDGPRWSKLSKTRLAAIGTCGALLFAVTCQMAVSQNEATAKSRPSAATAGKSDSAVRLIDATSAKTAVDRDTRVKELEKQLLDTRAELEKVRNRGSSAPQGDRPRDPADQWRDLPGPSRLQALPTLVSDSEQQKQLKRRYNAALRAEQLLTRQYEVGEARVNNLLDAEKTLLEAQFGLCKSEREETQARVNYFVAVKRIEAQAKAKLSMAGVTGSTPVDDEDLARSARLEAELKLRELLAARADTSPRKHTVTTTAATNLQPMTRPPANVSTGLPSANDLPVLKPLPGDSERQRLLKARYNAAVRAEELYNWQYEVGTARASDVLAAEKILLEAGLALCKSEQEEIQVREKYFNAVKRLEAQAKAKLEIGGVTGFSPVDEAQAREARLDAELKLLQERAPVAADNSPEQNPRPVAPPPLPNKSSKPRAETLPAMLTAKPLEPAPGDDELRKLLKERYNSALRALKGLYERLLIDSSMPSPMISIVSAGRTLLDAKLAISQGRDPIRVYEDYVELTKYFEALARSILQSKAGQMSPADFEAAHEARIDADIKLLQARRRSQADADRSQASIQSLETNVRIAKAEMEAAHATVDQNKAVIQRAEAYLEFRRVELGRIKKLFEQKAIDAGLVDESRKNYDAAAASLKAAQAAAGTAEAQLAVKKARLEAEIQLLQARGKPQADSDRSQASIQSLETIVRIAKAELEAAQATVDQNNADIQRARAYLEFRRVERSRIKKLFEQKAIDAGLVDESRKNYDAAAASLEATQAAAGTLEAQLAVKKARLEQAKNDLAGATSGSLPQGQPKSP